MVVAMPCIVGGGASNTQLLGSERSFLGWKEGFVNSSLLKVSVVLKKLFKK